MGSDRITVPHLQEDGKNFISWRSDILDLAAEKDLDIPKYITGDLDAANDTAGHDAAGMRIMRLRMGPSNKSIVRHAATAVDMMRALEDAYKPSGIISQVALRQELSDLRADETTDVPKHCMNALDLRSQLADVGAPIPDEQFCKTLLLSLPKSYLPFASTFKPEHFMPTSYDAMQDVTHVITVPGVTGTATTAGSAGSTTLPPAQPQTAGSYSFTVATKVQKQHPAEVTPNSLVRRINEEYRSRRARDSSRYARSRTPRTPHRFRTAAAAASHSRAAR